LIDAISTLPEWLKGAGRFALALPFTYHTFNGVRHLSWDLGKFLTIKGVYATGYATIAATFLSSAYLAFFF
jgi:succinate dehydrogenase (ubiquinone) cytochrome b560 subunit